MGSEYVAANSFQSVFVVLSLSHREFSDGAHCVSIGGHVRRCGEMMAGEFSSFSVSKIKIGKSSDASTDITSGFLRQWVWI